MPITVSVVIVNWNGKELLRACLESLRQQTLSDVEIIVVDNGSDDGSQAMLEEEFPHVTLYALERNTGFCHANNVGIRTAQGSYIALLNNDTVAAPNWLETLVAALEQRPGYSFASSCMLQMDDPARIDRVADSFCSCGFMFGLGNGERAAEVYREPFEIFGVCGGAAFFRREVFETIGLLDERYFAYLEDLDLNWRMAHAGLKGVYVPEAVVHHVGGGTSAGQRNPWVLRRTVRNVWLTMSKNVPFRVGWWMAPRIVLYHLYWMLKFRCVWSYVVGWCIYVVQEPRVYRDRMRILGGSKLSARQTRELLAREDRRVFEYLDRCARTHRGRPLGRFWRWMFRAR
jgi:GT2 family glycosyltransferase